MTKEELIAFERRVADAWEVGLIKAPVHLSGGNEDQLIELFKEIKPHDYVLSGHRNHYHALLHGVPADVLMASILGEKDELTKGRARSMGFISHHHRFYASAIVGGLCNVGVGVTWALAQRWRDDPLSIDEHASQRRVWCFVGDGAVDGGHFWESLQYAEGWDLPITFVVEDNDRATCTNKAARLGFVVGAECVYTIRRANPGRKVFYYDYQPTWPHVGTGTYVQF